LAGINKAIKKGFKLKWTGTDITDHHRHKKLTINHAVMVYPNELSRVEDSNLYLCRIVEHHVWALLNLIKEGG